MQLESFFSGYGTRFQNNKGVWGFSPLFMRHTDDGGFLNSWMMKQAAFNLDRRDILSATDNDILEAILNFRETVGVDNRSITGMEPAILDCGIRGLRIIVVAFHYHIAADRDFAQGLPVMRDFIAIFVHDPQLSGTDKLYSLSCFDLGEFIDKLDGTDTE